MTNALLALRDGRRDAPLKPWLYRIVHNESVSVLRRLRGHTELSEASMLADHSTEQRIETRARLEALVEDLQELPDRQRGALLMHELSGLSHEEIAETFGVSNGVVRQLVYEARRSLQEFGEGRAMSCDEICRTISDGDRRALRSRKVRAHMRTCSGCSAFAEAIPQRKNDLKAIAPPIPALAAAGVLSHVLGTGSTQAVASTTAAAAVGTGSGSGGATAGGTAAAGAGSGAGATAGVGAATAGKTALIALSGKAVAGIAAVAVATAGAGVAVQQIASNPASHHSVLSTSGTSGGTSGHGNANAHSQSHGVGNAGSPGAAAVSNSHQNGAGTGKHGSGANGNSSVSSTPGLHGTGAAAGGATSSTAAKNRKSGSHSKKGSATAGSSTTTAKRRHRRRSGASASSVSHVAVPPAPASAAHSRSAG